MPTAAHHSSSSGLEVGPTYTVPLRIIGLIVFFATLFGGTFTILPFVVEDVSMGIYIGSGVAIGVVLLSWYGLLRTWTTRRKFAACRLVLEDDAVAPGTPCHFTIEEKSGDCLGAAVIPRFSLQYRDVFHRVGGRKVYSHGPFSLDARVRSEFDASEGRPRVCGEFTVNPGEIKTDRPDENWVNQILVILTMHLADGRRCNFELPYACPP